MSTVVTPDGVRLHVEEAGSGPAILFIHEFGGTHESWEPQVRAFSRRHRCVVYAARGYPPSDVPAEGAYSQALAVSDALSVLDGLGIERAHIVGLSMGAFAALHFGLAHPERALSVVAAGVGYGSDPADQAAFRAASLAHAERFEREAGYGATYADQAARWPLRDKDSRGWGEFLGRIGRHSGAGAARTLRGVQARRPSLYALEEGLAAMRLAVLIVAGDADGLSLGPSLFLRRVIPGAGLAVLPRTGHTINLEEPALFNALLSEHIAGAQRTG